VIGVAFERLSLLRWRGWRAYALRELSPPFWCPWNSLCEPHQALAVALRLVGASVVAVLAAAAAAVVVAVVAVVATAGRSIHWVDTPCL
jgi:hypothetical protein